MRDDMPRFNCCSEAVAFSRKELQSGNPHFSFFLDCPPADQEQRERLEDELVDGLYFVDFGQKNGHLTVNFSSTKKLGYIHIEVTHQ